MTVNVPATMQGENEAYFHPIDERNHIYEAEINASDPITPFGIIKRGFFGRPLPETDAINERLSRPSALAILSSDALSSVAYGTEASLTVLLAAGITAMTSNLLIGLVIAALMIIVGTSYQQTIHAYPSGGGSYIVANDNLGKIPGLIAAAALLVDYILTVSVSVSAGVDALSSAFPVIMPASVTIEVILIALITYINMRGVREAGSILALPTFIFLGSFGLMLIVGLIKALILGPTHALPPQSSLLPSNPAPITLLLILTAFASGCSAMTGVEAISNGVPVFKGKTPSDQSKNASATLVVMVALLVSLFLGTTYLAWRVGATPHPSGSPTVTSQIATFAFTGWGGWFYYIVQSSTMLVLVFAANTSFADFPRLAYILARDKHMPVAFLIRGERIAFNTGILVLGIASAAILVVLRGQVTELINLYALGVFTAFTLSQSGMVVHWWRRQNEAGWRRRITINGIGAITTAIVTGVIAIAKFDRGGWFVIVLITALVALFIFVQRYYDLARIPDASTPPAEDRANVVIMPLLSHRLFERDPDIKREQFRHGNSWPGVISRELDYACKLSDTDIILVRLFEHEDEARTFEEKVRAYLKTRDEEIQQHTHVYAVVSPYRTVVNPMAFFVKYIAERPEFAGKSIAVLLPRQEHYHWWEFPLLRWTSRGTWNAINRFAIPNVKTVPFRFHLAPFRMKDIAGEV